MSSRANTCSLVIVDEFDTMSDEQIEAWLDERAEARVKAKHRASAEVQRHGIRTPRSTTALS